MVDTSPMVTIVISRDEGDDTRRRELEDSVAAACAERGAEVLVIPHLYHVPQGSDVWRAPEGVENLVAVASWLPPRAAEWTLRASVAAESDVRYVDLHTCLLAEDAVAALLESVDEGGGERDGPGGVGGDGAAMVPGDRRISLYSVPALPSVLPVWCLRAKRWGRAGSCESRQL